LANGGPQTFIFSSQGKQGEKTAVERETFLLTYCLRCLLVMEFRFDAILYSNWDDENHWCGTWWMFGRAGSLSWLL